MVVSFTLLPLYLQTTLPVPITRKAELATDPCWIFWRGENFLVFRIEGIGSRLTQLVTLWLNYVGRL